MASANRHAAVARIAAPLLLAAAMSCATPLSATAQTLTDACTRAFGDWVGLRDAQLQRIEPTPTLLGLDNTWCTSSLARIAQLRVKLDSVRSVCTGVTGDERARVDSLIIRSALLLDKVKFCPAQVAVTDAAPVWETSVKAQPVPKPAAQKAVVTERAAPEKTSAMAPAQPKRAAEKPVSERKAKAPDAPAAQAAAVEQSAPSPRKETAPRKEAAEQKVASVAAPAPHAPQPTADDKFAYLKQYAVQAGAPAEATAEEDECLVVRRTSAASYLIENKNCRPQVILTAIELNKPGQGMRCFTKKISDGIAIAGEGGHAPQINFQCKEGTEGCAEGMLRGMFPECQPG